MTRASIQTARCASQRLSEFRVSAADGEQWHAQRRRSRLADLASGTTRLLQAVTPPLGRQRACACLPGRSRPWDQGMQRGCRLALWAGTRTAVAGSATVTGPSCALLNFKSNRAETRTRPNVFKRRAHFVISRRGVAAGVISDGLRAHGCRSPPLGRRSFVGCRGAERRVRAARSLLRRYRGGVRRAERGTRASQHAGAVNAVVVAPRVQRTAARARYRRR